MGRYKVDKSALFCYNFYEVIPLNKQEQLNQLFEDWKEEHAKAANTDTFPSADLEMGFKNNFIPDGFLNENENGTVLFILKESNISKDHPTMLLEGSKNPFWAKDYCREQTRFFNRLKMLARKVTQKGAEEWWSYCAYMNINKRGGFSTCDSVRLANYIREYKPFIEEQIRRIDPQAIVFLGSNFKEARALLSLPKGVAVYYAYHPSYRFCNDDAYLKTLEKE